LSYYTGTILEAKANAGTFTPSIAGGGRYDNLTGVFGVEGLSGVGISFGIDRIYDVLEDLMLFPEWVDKQSTTRILLAHFDEDTQAHALTLAAALRQSNINTEVYPDAGKKLGKQFEYANKRMIPFVCAIGSNEMKSGIYPIKNMLTGQQLQVNKKEMIEHISKSDGLHN
jgi:histidyl-tRNA synthetase